MDFSDKSGPFKTATSAQLQTSFYNNYKCQAFSLPSSLVYYVAMNVSDVKVYQKVIQTCKYFFVKNPILVFSELHFDQGGWKVSNGIFKKRINIQNLSNKLWITGSLRIAGHQDISGHNTMPTLLKRLYRFDGSYLYLQKQQIRRDMLIKLSSNVIRLLLVDVEVSDDNVCFIPVEHVVELFPKVKTLRYCYTQFVKITTKTFQELSKSYVFSSMENFYLVGINENFDIESFSIFVKKNNNVNIHLSFCSTISEQFKIRLAAMVTEIVDDSIHNFKVPLIHFHGIDEELYQKMSNLHYNC